MNFHVLTLFPEMIEQACGHSILRRAIKTGLIKVNCINIRDFALDKHGQVDDAPYGGGSGMVIMAPPVCAAFNSVARPDSAFIYLSPRGKVFNQAMAVKLAKEEDIILLCGHYEGIDQRIIEILGPKEVSIGDYILTGGELAALVVIDAVARLSPGVVGKNKSVDNESFSDSMKGLLEYPQYTRPQEFKGFSVPSILLSGHHAKIEEWRRNQSFERTKIMRPDLIV